MIKTEKRRLGAVATQSILKNVVIRDEKSALALVEALEKASTFQKPSTSPEYTVNDIKGEQIRKFFGEDK